MEDRGMYEKLSIRESARSLKKYGSTSKHVMKNENYIKHTVTSTDTLQGIALKYGVTMEQIRRVNRLWASDSLFLRENLLIPTNENTFVTSPTSDIGSAASTPSTSHQSPESSEDVDVNQFLGKIDASIASTKEEVRKAQGHSEFAVSLDFVSERKKPATSRMKKNMNNNSNEVFSTPQTVVMTQGNKIKTSMKKYECQQDELFEL
ncbi:hypothetical protein MML48_2g00019889 [Holotrichia oblita]|uniref:Uncharacterized protein n=4 Tax=Holotrichia oblita TaxID=644536 RepID=A0ACB9TNW2_HOLOL|nr:hypothetical protein MML48_2g00005735 [Holotrichia oblita]KAI4468452.1 hypothetical protein MML48_2g00006639 [Holotrichia oblita]KAI4468467.1 hypothetical protein MML48_2g00017446 [Holotrichia oblita]KAI4468475.1 hypothetical protein MML48_2g00019889 [Holotrichia oblita]